LKSADIGIDNFSPSIIDFNLSGISTIATLIASNNANNIFTQYIETGIFEPKLFHLYMLDLIHYHLQIYLSLSIQLPNVGIVYNYIYLPHL